MRVNASWARGWSGIETRDKVGLEEQHAKSSHFGTRNRPPLPAYHEPKKIRLLLGCQGWPSGLLDVGSWAKHQGLAEASIFQIQPGYAFPLNAEDRPYLRPGIVDPKMVDSFRRHGRRLSEDANVLDLDDQTWEIRDHRRDTLYRVLAVTEGLDALDRMRQD